VLTLIVHGNESTKTDTAVGIGIISGLLLAGDFVFLFCKEEFNRQKEVAARLHKTSFFFGKNTTFHGSILSKLVRATSIDFNCKVSDVHSERADGEYPTYFPDGDIMQFQKNPEVFDPDFVH
jgi:hypothetical protein